MSKTSKGFKQFLILWLGDLIASIGSGMTAFGLGVYVWQLTGSALDVGMVETAALLPAILLAPIAGVLADRYDRRLLMVLGDFVSALGLILMLILMALGNIKVLQIVFCVGFNSVFVSLLSPAFKATITDLLSEEEYTKASGMMGISSSSKFLISPVLGGIIMAAFGMEVILLIDIFTIFITIMAILAVRKSIAVKSTVKKEFNFIRDLKEGWLVIVESKGVVVLISLVSLLMFYLGFIQMLSKPMILSFTNEQVTGLMQTICALGMMVSSIVIGGGILKKNYVNVLVLSCVVAGVAMAGFGATTTIPVIVVFGFIFFASLPYATASIDVLIRKSIDNEKQGRAWGLISLISQLGFVLAYILSGVLTDYVFEPALKEGGILANSIGRLIGTGEGRGIGFLLIIAGAGLVITALFTSKSKSIRQLEKAE
ncbi:MAG: MFS transporter [Christensenellaceae bacterium]|nr:MFS transporter [Christensenellaceae bacterium]